MKKPTSDHSVKKLTIKRENITIMKWYSYLNLQSCGMRIKRGEKTNVKSKERLSVVEKKRKAVAPVPELAAKNSKVDIERIIDDVLIK